MTMTRLSTFVAATSLAIMSATVVYAQQPKPAASTSAVASPKGPWLGTWKRNAEKSTTRMGAGGTTIFKMWQEGEDGFRYTIDSTTASGEPGTHAEAFGRFDGKPYPEKGNPNADFNAFKRVDDHTYSVVDLKDGKETFNIMITISADGKTRTSVSKGRDAQGKEMSSTSVYDRVE